MSPKVRKRLSRKNTSYFDTTQLALGALDVLIIKYRALTFIWLFVITDTSLPTHRDEDTVSEAATNAIRDQLLVLVTPGQADLIRTRNQVVDKWCEEHGVTRGEISIDQILVIRSLPEWKGAS